jgi:hypothetical protein
MGWKWTIVDNPQKRYPANVENSFMGIILGIRIIYTVYFFNRSI